MRSVNRTITALTVGVSVLMLFSGCGYRMTNAGSRISSADCTINIPIVTNSTFKPSIETRFTNSLVDEFAGRGCKVVAGSDAPRTLAVTILSYSSTAISYSAQDQVRAYRATITADSVLRETASQKVVWKGQVVWSENYPASTDIALQTNNEDTAIIAVTSRLAQMIYQNIIQDF